MRNSKICTVVLATIVTIGTISTGFAEQSKDTAKDSSNMMKREDMHMMEGNKMPMMDMQEMSKMMKNCNAMMENMNQHMGMESPKGDSKAQ